MTAPATPLQGARLLVVEDEAMVAMMVEDQLTDLGCIVIGVVASVASALKAIEQSATVLDAAVLDINLGGDKAYPIAERLMELGIPFIFATGYGVSGVAPDFTQVPTLSKPSTAKSLEAMLVSVLPGHVPGIDARVL